MLSAITCAGYPSGGRDTCQNDSGGSMVCRVNGNFSHVLSKNICLPKTNNIFVMNCLLFLIFGGNAGQIL